MNTDVMRDGTVTAASLIFAVFAGIVIGTLLGLATNVKHIKHTLDRMEKQQRTNACTHGASSIVAEMRNGKLHVSVPTVTGCQP